MGTTFEVTARDHQGGAPTTPRRTPATDVGHQRSRWVDARRIDPELVAVRLSGES